MSSMMMSMNDDGWSTVASAKKGSKHTATAPRLAPQQSSGGSSYKSKKLTFSEMQEELEAADHVAIAVAPSAREIRKEVARAAEKAAPTNANSYVQFPILSSNSAASVGQKPKLDFRAIAVAAAAKPTPPNPPVTKLESESLPFILRSTVPIGPDRIVWVEEGYAGGYGYEFDETAYDMEPMWEEDENGDEYITDDRAAFNSRRYGDNSDW